jgi:Golgi phosphoprotein 3 GPP34
MLSQVAYERLAASGVLRAAQRRALGIFPTRTWPTQDPQHEAEVRQLVTQALVQPGAPDERTAALIALLHALKCEHKVVDARPYQLSRRQLRARAAEIAQGNWASEAVRKAIEEMMAAAAASGATSV